MEIRPPQGRSDRSCPLRGGKTCDRTCFFKNVKCEFYILLRGKSPQTGEDIDEWGCAVSFMPMLLIENAKQVRQGAAATESFRNEMVQANFAAMNLVAYGPQAKSMKLIGT